MKNLSIESIKTQIESIESKIESLQNEINNFEIEISEDQFNDFLDDCYPEIEVLGMTYAVSHALKEIDPVAYNCAKSEYESNYDLGDCQEYTDLKEELETLESELESLNEQLDELESSEDDED